MGDRGMDNWLDHVDLGDGEEADLLTRLPYDRQQAVLMATDRDESITQAMLDQLAPGAKVPKRFGWAGWGDAVLRAHLHRGKFRDFLTREDTDELGRADPKKIGVLRSRAIELHLLWQKEAMGGPKDSTETEPSSKDGSPDSETSE